MRKETGKPWHQHPLVWMIIAIPLAAVVAGGVTLWLAIESDDGLVVDDYYQQGKEINRVLARDHRASELGLRGQLGIRASDNSVQLILASSEGAALPASIEVKLLHATRAGYDQQVTLKHLGNGNYSGKIETELARGAWNVQVGNETWRLIGRFKVPDSLHTALTPAVRRASEE